MGLATLVLKECVEGMEVVTSGRMLILMTVVRMVMVFADRIVG